QPPAVRRNGVHSKKDLKSAVFKMKNKFIGLLTPAEQQLLIDFGDRAIWNPAFRDREVFSDFVAVLMNSGLVQADEIPALEGTKDLVIMYVLSTFHGTRISLGDGKFCDLQAGYDNRQGNLEVTADILSSTSPKRISQKCCLFWTEMSGSDFCDPALGKGPWEGLIALEGGKLVAVD
ncbi:hypothetical protein, partial [Devosia elaeis]|uniref:hypothetical protein n=1 Tax=Devosia elaeis TaxID=1770058 RepID=UPI00196A1B35